ncbi:hypothetical protein BGZ58_009560 [Dissophora ornata]|nr:hypothetical protein BGZ58_009560 [Dissophora ornata]
MAAAKRLPPFNSSVSSFPTDSQIVEEEEEEEEEESRDDHEDEVESIPLNDDDEQEIVQMRDRDKDPRQVNNLSKTATNGERRGSKQKSDNSDNNRINKGIIITIQNKGMSKMQEQE